MSQAAEAVSQARAPGEPALKVTNLVTRFDTPEDVIVSGVGCEDNNVGIQLIPQDLGNGLDAVHLGHL